VEDASKSVASTYVQVNDSLWIDDWIRNGTQWSRLGQGLMGSVPVVKLFVLAQSVTQVAFVPQQCTCRKIHPCSSNGM
jgi:hypothetical protein